MDFILRENLPIELVHVIMKNVHNRYMVDLINEIENNVVWIRTGEGEYSSLVGKTSNNPYYVLRETLSQNFKCPNQKLKQIVYRKYLRLN